MYPVIINLIHALLACSHLIKNLQTINGNQAYVQSELQILKLWIVNQDHLALSCIYFQSGFEIFSETHTDPYLSEGAKTVMKAFKGFIRKIFVNLQVE